MVVLLRILVGLAAAFVWFLAKKGLMSEAVSPTLVVAFVSVLGASAVWCVLSMAREAWRLTANRSPSTATLAGRATQRHPSCYQCMRTMPDKARFCGQCGQERACWETEG